MPSPVIAAIWPQAFRGFTILSLCFGETRAKQQLFRPFRQDGLQIDDPAQFQSLPVRGLPEGLIPGQWPKLQGAAKY